MRNHVAFPLLLVAALWLSACTMSRPPAYDLPAAEGLYPGEEITVGANENLYVIAQRHNVRLRDLIVVNKLTPPYRVKAGQSIYLPTRDGDTAPTPKAAPLEYIDKGDMGPKVSHSGTGTDSVTSISLDAPTPIPQGEPKKTTTTTMVLTSPPPTANSVQTPPPAPDAPTTPATTTAGTFSTQTKTRAATDVPEVDISDLQKELSAETAREQAAPGATAEQPTTSSAASFDGAPAFVWPVRGTIISAFGPKGKGRDNDGINIAAPKASPVKAAGSGTVAYAGNEMKGFGNLVLIRHPGGWVTAYAHLERIMVMRDATVREGDMIGTIGTTGDVGSPQLHFEARRDGKPVDPELVLK